MGKLEKQFEELKRAHGSGVLCISNFGGIEVVLSNDGSGILYKRYDKLCRRWQKIKYSASGRGYFTIWHTRYYLDNFMLSS